jgi:hypothetical protein
MDKLGATKPWFYNVQQGKVSDKAIHYYLNDSLYKNDLSLYKNAASNLTRHVINFNQNAIDACRRIAELTGKVKELPDFIPHHLIDVTPQQFQELKGNYTLVKAKTATGEIQELNSPGLMKVDDQNLEYVEIASNSTFNLYFKNNITLYGLDFEVTILKDKKNRVIGLISKYIDGELEFIKTYTN